MAIKSEVKLCSSNCSNLPGKVINVLDKIGNQEAANSLRQIIGDDASTKSGVLLILKNFYNEFNVGE